MLQALGVFVYQLSGLWYTSCAWLIEPALLGEQGAVSAEVMFTSDLTEGPIFSPAHCPVPDPSTVESLAYRAAEYSGERELDDAEWHDLVLRLGIAAGLRMNVMLFSLVVFASYFEGLADWARQSVAFQLMARTTPAVFYSAWPILWVADHGLRNGSSRMQVLISTGVLAAYYSPLQRHPAPPSSSNGSVRTARLSRWPETRCWPSRES